MKPDWKDAPDWANWTAMDNDGDWFWYERLPRATIHQWEDGGRVEKASEANFKGWADSLEGRPA